jgi:hypothetical protein
MSEDPVRKYLDAKREFDSAYARIQNMLQTISEVHSGLHRPFTFIVTNGGVEFSREAIATKTASLNAETWPSGKDIAEALAGLQETYRMVEASWKSIPETDRRNITPPPGRR